MLEAIALGDVFASRNDLKIGRDVKPGHALTAQRNDVIYMEAAAFSVHPVAFRIDGLDSLAVSPPRYSLRFRGSSFCSVGKRLDVMASAKRGRLIVPAARRVRTVADSDPLPLRSAPSQGLAMILFAQSAGAHFTTPRDGGTRNTQSDGMQTRMTATT